MYYKEKVLLQRIIEKGRNILFSNYYSLVFTRNKVHVISEGHQILQNLHCSFDWHYIGQIYGEDFAKFCGLFRDAIYFSINFKNKNHLLGKKSYLSLDSSKLTLFCLARLYDECISSTWRARVSFSSFFIVN